MKVIVKLDDALDKQFRETVGRVKGAYRGVLREAIQEALKDWIEKCKNIARPPQPIPASERVKVRGKKL